jgi:hypothetical protein
MQKQTTTWHHLAVVASCGVAIFAAAGADKKDAPKPPPPEIIKAWTDAGATVSEYGQETMFEFRSWKAGVLEKLPDPGVAFGLRLSGTQVTDAALTELTGLKSLRTLNLANTPVTDAGLNSLAGLKTLQGLNLAFTKVTDVGLKELAGLKGLQELKL